MNRILVWDAPTRIAHWLMAGSFALAFATGDSEAWRIVHVVAGYVFAALIAFRLVWGVVGTRYARFSEFVKSPTAAAHYLASLLSREPQHYIGHNPAAGYAILALLALGVLTVASGLARYAEFGGETLEEVHEALANASLLMVGIHLLGVAVGSLVHRENLAAAMFTGFKPGRPSDAIGGARWFAAGLMLVWVWLAAVLLHRALG